MSNTNVVVQNPVWYVYDESRTARLNVYYYQTQLDRLRRWNFVIELILALSVSSGIAGLWFWQTNFGDIIWKALVTLAAVLSVIKPLVNFTQHIQQKSEIVIKWRLLDDKLKDLIMRISERHKFDNELRQNFHKLLETKSIIHQAEPTEGVDEKLRMQCFERVKQELPVTSFVVPEG